MQPIDIKIRQTILNMGVSGKLSGCKYLVEAVSMAVEMDGKISGRLTKEIYPEIAKKNKANVASVEKNIRTAITFAWNHGAPGQIQRVFGESGFYKVEKPSASAFISAVAEYIIKGEEIEEIHYLEA